eukprot:8577962-Ditylum_brightwellii.AAC.1
MACLGSQCEKTTLRLLRGDLMNNGEDTKDDFCDLDIAVDEGIIKNCGSKYAFAHDQIQHAAYFLIPQCEQTLWHFQIGMQMLGA